MDSSMCLLPVVYRCVYATAPIDRTIVGQVSPESDNESGKVLYPFVLYNLFYTKHLMRCLSAGRYL